MTCANPLHGFKTESGGVVWSARKGADTELQVPCGRCVPCRVARSRSWALRITHEAKLWPSSWFLTLTYADPPPGGSLHYRHVQLFLKRLRRQVKTRLRFFCVGEYGDQLERPHYHVCLFNAELPDLVKLGLESRSFSSALLERAWSHGFVQVDHLNYSTAAYAARYIFKKISGDLAEQHYSRVDADGVVTSLVPEFCRMSLRPGIGAEWFERFGREYFEHGFVVHNGAPHSIPKYYDRLQKRADPSILAGAKEDREAAALTRDTSWQRALASAEVEEARIRHFSQREFEHDSSRRRSV